MSFKTLLLLLVTIFIVGLIFVGLASASVIRDGKKVYIEDHTGERWDVTQAKSIGFKPERFQYGIGRNAFTPLDDSFLAEDTSSLSHNPRVIGVTDGTEARAYSVPKLRYHEIANSHIGEEPIAAGY
jgi:hypothetical protein